MTNLKFAALKPPSQNFKFTLCIYDIDSSGTEGSGKKIWIAKSIVEGKHFGYDIINVGREVLSGHETTWPISKTCNSCEAMKNEIQDIKNSLKGYK